MSGAQVRTLRLRDFSHGAPIERERFADAFRAGLEELGFVVVEEHGVDPALVRRAYAAFTRFFELPEAEKLRCGGSEGGQRGYTPFGVEHARDSKTPDLKAFFHVGPRDARYPPNLWPASVSELRAAATSLHDALAACARSLLAALEGACGLVPGAFADTLEGGNSILRAAYYPPLIAAPPPGSLRAAAHEDINLITLLCEATESGLEILTPDGEWLAIEAGPGQIVVDSGDMLTRLTGGVIPATTHRVVNPELAAPGAARARLSLPFFAHPAPECELSVVAPFRSAARLAAHPPTTAGHYLDERLREIGLRGQG